MTRSKPMNVSHTYCHKLPSRKVKPIHTQPGGEGTVTAVQPVTPYAALFKSIFFGREHAGVYTEVET